MLPDPRLVKRATAHLRKSDPVLAQIMGEVGACRWRVDRRGGAFAALVESIVYQQITGAAAATIYGRLRALVGRRHPRPEDILRARAPQLRKAGLSRQKIAYLRDLARRARNGLSLRRFSRREDEAVIAELVAVKGIGRWTAEMFLIFRLGRPDVLPVHDYGIRKAMRNAYGLADLPKPEEMQRITEGWRPYRTLGCWYLWRSLDTRGRAAKP
jgi:3-methyladenine DNA glycosylase/8-oxoguanine DNA glycosylase